MAETRGQGTLYRQKNSRFWWYRIGFQLRIICASTKTTDRREAREVLKQKYRELEAAKGGFVTMPGPETKRIAVGQLLDELLADYELHGRRSIKGGPVTRQASARGARGDPGGGPQAEGPD